MNRLYYGDNLDILPEHFPDESVDLIYLDPPFNSNASYNILFSEKSGEKSKSQIQAFTDTWEWSQDSEKLFYKILNEHGGKLADVMKSLRGFLGQKNDMMAYLVRMAATLAELRRVLKKSGTIWLHCDPTASHYLKQVMDAVFGPTRFLNEVVWVRSSAHSDSKQGMKRCGRIHDVLLVYSKTDDYTWNTQHTPYDKEYLESEYRHKTEDGRHYKETDLTAAKPGGDVEYEWRVKRPPIKGARWEADLKDEYKKPKEGWEYLGVFPYEGRFWAYSKTNLIAFAKSGNLIHRKTGMPRLVQYADEMPGVPLQDIWTDIPPVSGYEDLGYPTQKPRELLKRVISVSSNKGDVVLDPFCGCGTTVEAAQELGREWQGIDVTSLAINQVRYRIRTRFKELIKDIDSLYEVIGEPTSVTDAEALAEQDRYQFQWWALSLVGARPFEKKKGADKGIDGRLFFSDGDDQHIILSVKSGKVGSPDIRDLGHVVEREEAALGVLLTLKPPTKDMTLEAQGTGYYKSPWGIHPKIQILTIAELLDGKRIDYPPDQQVNLTLKKAKSFKPTDAERQAFNFDKNE